MMKNKLNIIINNNIQNDEKLKKEISFVIKKVKHKILTSSFIKLVNKPNSNIDITIDLVNHNHDYGYYIWHNGKINNWTIYLSKSNIDIINNTWNKQKSKNAIINFVLVYIYQIYLINRIYMNLSRYGDSFKKAKDLEWFLYNITSHEADINDIRCCVFNFTVNKSNIKFKFEEPIICNDCKNKLLKETTLSKYDIEKISNEMSNLLVRSWNNFKFFSYLKQRYWFLVILLSIFISLCSVISLVVSILSLI